MKMTLPPHDISFEGYGPAEFAALRRRLNEANPPERLEDLDLVSELISSYRAAKDVLELADDDTPLNQQSQVLNTITSICKQLTQMQRDLYSAARLQRFEKLLGEILKEHNLYETYASRLEEL